MSTKATLRIRRLRRARLAWSAFAIGVKGRISRAALMLSHVCSGRDTPASTESDVPGLTRLPVQPPRERGTCRAFALAVALHTALAAFLFSGVRWQTSAPAGTEVGVADRSTPARSPLPVSSVTNKLTPTAHNDDRPIHIASQPKMHRRRQAVHQAQLAKRPRQAPPIRTQLAKTGEKAAQQAGASADQQHEERLAALQALAADGSSGNGMRADSGVTASPGYADRVRRRVRPNVVAPIDIVGNPSAVIAVRCAPDGALLNATMRHSSGNPQWDSAALSAVEKSNPMPRDVNGSAPASFLITFRPKG